MADQTSQTSRPDPRFFGTWTLVQTECEVVETGEKLETDRVSKGVISYQPDGHMTVVIAHERPGKPEPGIVCYAALWSVEGGTVYHDVDISNRTRWVGERQVRHFTFQDDLLILRPPVSEEYESRIVTRRALIWRKAPERVMPR